MNLLKKTICLTMICGMMSNLVHASGYKTVDAELARTQVSEAFQAYNYYMDDWDGKDVQYKNDSVERLNDQLEDLIDSGVSVQDIQAVMEARILNPRKKVEYKNLLNTLKNQYASDEVILEKSISFMDETQATGAAFGSGAGINYKTVAIVIGALLVATVTILLLSKRAKDGKDGIDGKDGAQGPQGIQGMKGDKGDKGDKGEKGDKGDAGKDGRDGIDGKDGRDGIDGKDGMNGKDGIDGKDGKDGIDGKDGKDGEDGVDGKDGMNGKDGINGVDGKDGMNGKDGKNGIDGKDGKDGKNGSCYCPPGGGNKKCKKK